MPADAIAAILADSPLHLWTMRESASGFTTFADEVSSGNLPLSAGSGCTPSAWGNIAGYREAGGPQTPAPQFDGTANAYARASGAVLGGRALGWGIVAWMDSTLTSLASKTLYCERGSSGNDVLMFQINSSQVLSLVLCDDTVGNLKTAGTPSTDSVVRGGKGQFNAGGQMLGVSVDATGKVSFYRDGPFGVGTSSVTLSSSHTWSNPGITTNIGIDPANLANAFNGTLCWVAVFGAAFTAAQFDNWYRATTPEPAGGAAWKRSVGGAVCPNSDFWNKPLADTAPLDPNSAAIISQWTSYATAHSLIYGVTPYVPMYNLDTAVVASHKGVRTNFLITQDQNNFLATVPTPTPLITGDPYPANLNSDAHAWCASPTSGLMYDIYQGLRLENASVAAPFPLLPPWIYSATVTVGAGTLSPGAYFYVFTSLDASGQESFGPGGFSQGLKVVVSSTGAVSFTLLIDLRGASPVTHWNVYRRGPYPTAGPFGSNADYGLIGTITGLVQGTNTGAFTDTGLAADTSQKPTVLGGGSTTNTWGTGGSSRVTDPASIGGGGSWDFLKNGAFYPAFKPSGTTNNGASASSCPDGAGVITLEEALAGTILHPIVVAMPTGNQSQAIQGHQWPAPRHDGTYSGTGLPTQEGMRLRLPHTFDPTTVTYNAYTPLATFQRAIVTAMRDYGLVIRDSSNSALLMYLEDTPQTGRAGFTYVFGGLSGGAASVASVLNPMPWSSLQVLAPSRYPSRADGSGRRTNRLDVAGNPTPVPY